MITPPKDTYRADDLLAGVAPPPLTLDQLRLAVGYCANFRPTTDQHVGILAKPWVVIAAGLLGLASFAEPGGDPLTPGAIRTLVGDDALTICAAAWLTELSQRKFGRPGGGPLAPKHARDLFRKGLTGRNLDRVRQSANNQYALLVAAGHLPAVEAADGDSATVRCFLSDHPLVPKPVYTHTPEQMAAHDLVLRGQRQGEGRVEGPAPVPDAEIADTLINPLPGFAAPAQIDLSQLREAIGHCAEYKPDCIVTPAPGGTPVPAWVVLRAAQVQLSAVCKVDGRRMSVSDVEALAGVTALTTVDAASVFALTHARRLWLDAQHLAVAARQEALLREAFALRDRALVDRLYLRQYALLISGGAILAPAGYLLGEGASAGWGARAGWGLAVGEFTQLLSEFSSAPDANVRPAFADPDAVLALALSMAGDPGVSDAPATLCGFAIPAQLSLPLLREAIGHCANYAPDYDVYCDPDGRPVPAWVVLRAARLGPTPVTGIGGVPMSRGDVEGLAGPAALITTEAEWASGFTGIVSASLDGAHVAAYARQSALLHDAYDRRDQDRVAALFLREIALLVSAGEVTATVQASSPDTPDTAWGVACAEFDELLREFPTAPAAAAGPAIQDTDSPDTVFTPQDLPAAGDATGGPLQGGAKRATSGATLLDAISVPIAAIVASVVTIPAAVWPSVRPVAWACWGLGVLLFLRLGWRGMRHARAERHGVAAAGVAPIQEDSGARPHDVAAPQGTHAVDAGRCSDSGTTFGLWGRYALGMATMYATIRFGVSWLFAVLPSWAAFAVAIGLASAAFWLTRNSRNAWLAHWLGTGHIRHGHR